MTRKNIRRITLTISLDPKDPLESTLLKLYDSIPAKGYRRIQFLRRSLLMGLATGVVMEQPTTFEKLSRTIQS